MSKYKTIDIYRLMQAQTNNTIPTHAFADPYITPEEFEGREVRYKTAGSTFAAAAGVQNA